MSTHCSSLKEGANRVHSFHVAHLVELRANRDLQFKLRQEVDEILLQILPGRGGCALHLLRKSEIIRLQLL